MKKFTLILIGAFLASLFVFGQQKQITLNLKNVTIKEALESLKTTGGYSYWFDAKDLDISQKVSINVVNKTIDEVLVLLFKGQKVEYKIKDGHIVISKSVEKEPSVQKKNEIKKVTGLVLDEKGIPVIGASIMIPGTKIAVITDVNGKFSIEAPNASKIRISYIGYDAKEEAIKGSSIMEISLFESPKKLDEVVVVGYGSQKKETVVGAISTIRAATLVQTPVTNLSNALNGRLPGLVAMQRQGEPGNDEAEIYIRGKSTFDGMSAKPLTLVDGIERPFAQIDANEVETITVLKDASATAVYGVRGANGVILVTTKRGLEGPAQISFSAQMGFQNPTRRPPFKNAMLVTALEQDAYYNDFNGQLHYTKNQLATIARSVYGTATEDEKLLYPNNNWFREVTRDNTPQQQYNLNIRGGNKIVRYFISGGYFNQGGYFKDFSEQYYKGVKQYNSNYQFDRYNFRSNIDIDITNNFSATVNLAGRIEKINSPRTNNTFWQLYSINSIRAPIFYPGYGFASLGSIFNPVGELTQGGFNNLSKSTMESSIILKYDLDFLTKGLSARANISFDSEYDYNMNFYQGFAQYTRDWNTTDRAEYIKSGEDSPLVENGQWYNNTNKRYEEIGLNYTRKFAKHDLTGLLLYNQQEYRSGAQTPFVYQGLVGRATYRLDNKYLAEVNVGYNGSENFVKGKRFGLFPSIALGWVVSEEKFISNLDFISWLKIRGSYGEVGNDKLYINGQLQRFLYYNDYAQNSNGYIFGTGGRIEPYITEGRIGNNDVTWERAKKSNIGLDASFFNQKLGFTFDLFQEYRSDILLSQNGTVPNTLGADLPAVNKGRTKNGGFELELTHQDKLGDLSYQVRGNYTFARSEIIFMDEPSSVVPWQRSTGRPIGISNMYQCLGFFQSLEDIANSPSQAIFGKTSVGDRKYLDYNKDGVINTFDQFPSQFSEIPEITYGLTMSCQYKSLDFSILLQGVDNVSISWLNDLVTDNSNRWSPFFTAEQNAKATYPTPHTGSGNKNNNQQSFGPLGNTLSGQYIKLKNIEIGYTLPKSVFKFIRINAWRFYVNGLNLAILQDHVKFLDPESGSGGGLNYPQMKVVNFGLNIKF